MVDKDGTILHFLWLFIKTDLGNCCGILPVNQELQHSHIPKHAHNTTLNIIWILGQNSFNSQSKHFLKLIHTSCPMACTWQLEFYSSHALPSRKKHLPQSLKWKRSCTWSYQDKLQHLHIGNTCIHKTKTFESLQGKHLQNVTPTGSFSSTCGKKITVHATNVSPSFSETVHSTAKGRPSTSKHAYTQNRASTIKQATKEALYWSILTHLCQALI